jgi:SCY1-like protein 2
MTEKLIPLLRNIKTKEPSVTLASLAVYAEMGTKLGHDVIAMDIIPALWPMTVGVLLNMEQVPLDDIVSNVKFNRLMGVIRELETKVIKQQTQKLQELGPSVTSKGAISPMQENPSLGPMEETSLDFENLVLGKKSPATNNIPSSSPASGIQQSPPQYPHEQYHDTHATNFTDTATPCVKHLLSTSYTFPVHRHNRSILRCHTEEWSLSDSQRGI